VCRVEVGGCLQLSFDLLLFHQRLHEALAFKVASKLANLLDRGLSSGKLCCASRLFLLFRCARALRKANGNLATISTDLGILWFTCLSKNRGPRNRRRCVLAKHSRDCGFDQPAPTFKTTFPSTVETVLNSEGSHQVAGFGFASFLAHFFPKRSGTKIQCRGFFLGRKASSSYQHKRSPLKRVGVLAGFDHRQLCIAKRGGVWMAFQDIPVELHHQVGGGYVTPGF